MKPSRTFRQLAALAIATIGVAVGCSDDPVAPHPRQDASGGATIARAVVISPDITAFDLGVNASAYGINDDGVVVGQSGDLAALWSPAGEMRVIRSDCPTCDPNDSPSAAMDVDNHGRVVGFYTLHEGALSPAIRGAFLWSEADGFRDAGWIDLAGRNANPSGTTAFAINDAGSIVGESPRSPAVFPFEHAFLRSPAGLVQDLTPSITDWSRASGINAQGDVVGFAVLPGSFGSSEHAIIWRGGGSMLDLGTFGGPSGNARAINDAGVVVGTAMNSSFIHQAFRWTPATGMQPLAGTGGRADLPRAINNRGFIAGETSTWNPPYHTRAIVWTPDGRVIDLGTLGGENSSAYAINSTGQVAGVSEDAAGQKHAVRWDIRTEINHAPLANAGGPYRGVEGSPVAFDRATAVDPDGDPVSSTWAFGDGATGSGLLVSHSYVDNGDYTATLTATDPGGLVGTGTAFVTVSNLPPTVNLDAQAPITSGQSFRLHGTFSDPGVNDAPWRYVVNWSTGSPTSGSTSDQTAPLFLDSPRYCAPGTYEVWLIVTDKDDGVRSAMIRTTVNPNPVVVRTNVASLNPRSKGTLPVTILSTSALDARQIEPSTVTLGNATEGLVSISRHPDGELFASSADVNGDGFLDLVVHFDRADVAAAGLLNSSPAVLTVRAKMSDACRAVLGSTAVRVVGGGR